MKICSFASGSSGNCIYVETGHACILVDAGISCKRVIEGVSSTGNTPDRIDAVLLTHEHSDHIRGLGVLLRKYRIPVYTTAGTWGSIINSEGIGEIDRSLFNRISPDTPFSINDLTVTPFTASHDASQPVCYTFIKGEKKISIATDLGCYDEYTAEMMMNSDLVFIEANHDINMLKNGSYPQFLKRRILGERGHLSNSAAGDLLAGIYSSRLKHIVLGHLSRENNTPRLAYDTVSGRLISEGIVPGADCELVVSARESITPAIEL